MWISVNDHLPDDEEGFDECASSFLITGVEVDGTKFVTDGYFDTNEQRFAWFGPSDDWIEATHWMHMPEPAE